MTLVVTKSDRRSALYILVLPTATTWNLGQFFQCSVSWKINKDLHWAEHIDAQQQEVQSSAHIIDIAKIEITI